jgi:hypothetical protein
MSDRLREASTWRGCVVLLAVVAVMSDIPIDRAVQTATAVIGLIEIVRRG